MNVKTVKHLDVEALHAPAAESVVETVKRASWYAAELAAMCNAAADDMVTATGAELDPRALLGTVRDHLGALCVELDDAADRHSLAGEVA